MSKEEEKVYEIRFFLRENREEDANLFEMLKEMMERLHPIKIGEVGKYIFQKAYENWYLKEKKKD